VGRTRLLWAFFKEGTFVNVVKYILLVSILFISQAVFATLPTFGTASESKYAREFSPPANKSLIYIYYRLDDGNDVSPPIKLNNYDIGRLVPGSFMVWKLSPGRLELRVNGARSSGVGISSRAGRVYRFRLSVRQTAAGPEPELILVRGSDRSDMAATRLLKNPRSVTELAASTQSSPAVTQQSPRTTTSEPVAKAEAQPEPRTESKPQPGPQFASSSGIVSGGFGLMLKAGALTLSEETQLILGSNRSFDDSATPFSAELYYQYPSGLAIGGEITSYTASFTTTGLNDKHDVDVLLFLGNVKKYFRSNASLQPYIGAGIGYATTDTSGPSISGNTSGVTYQLLGGIEYRGAEVGVFGEFKYISADTESDNNESIDVSGMGILGGIAFHF
jgi:opacity protein-like surface antigen